MLQANYICDIFQVAVLMIAYGCHSINSSEKLRNVINVYGKD